MKYIVENMPKDFLKDSNYSEFVKKTLYYVAKDEKEIQDLFQKDEFYPCSTTIHYKNVVERINMYIEKDMSVVISGDFDCDGICATTLLYRFLKSKLTKIGYYIPNRNKDGYGLSEKLVDLYYQKNYQVIICVDNGVVAHQAIQKAQELGMEVIILDHHEMDEKTASYSYVLHPQLMEEEYHYLCGTGVVFEVLRYFKEIDEFDITLAALAAISDMMELKKENRVVIRKALAYLNSEREQHIDALLGDTTTRIDDTILAMRIAPKINAIGRMYDIANANNVVKFLLSTDAVEIDYIAKQINSINEERKKVTRQSVAQLEGYLSEDEPFYFIALPLHEGIVGLIASQLVNKYNKLTFVVTSEDGERYKGSCRSIAGIDLVDMLRNCPYLDSFGGHKMAGGLEIRKENFENFKEYVMEYLQTHTYEEYISPVIELNEYPCVKDVAFVASLRPFHRLQKEPLYKICGCKETSAVMMSNGKHAKWLINQENEVIYFNSKKEYFDAPSSYFICKVCVNEFRGVRKNNFLVEDFVTF